MPCSITGPLWVKRKGMHRRTLLESLVNISINTFQKRSLMGASAKFEVNLINSFHESAWKLLSMMDQNWMQWQSYFVIPHPLKIRIYNQYVDGLVQERRNSSALELRLSCTNPSICLAKFVKINPYFHKLNHFPKLAIALISNSN